MTDLKLLRDPSDNGSTCTGHLLLLRSVEILKLSLEPKLGHFGLVGAPFGLMPITFAIGFAHFTAAKTQMAVTAVPIIAPVDA